MARHGRFDPETEAEFRSASYDQAVAIVRFGLLLAIALYAAFGVLDVYMLPESHRVAWLIRFAVVVPVLLVTLAASTRPGFFGAFRPGIMAVSLVLGGGILAMIALSRPGEPGRPDYYTGLLLVILWIGTFSQLGGRDAAICVSTLLAGYAVVLLGQPDPVGGGLANPAVAARVGNIFFLAGGAILAIFSAYSFEQLKRTRFLQRRALRAEQGKTQALLAKVETLFGQQVSAEVARELAHGAAEVESRLCEVSVLFLDIREFSRYADSRPPEEVADFQNVVFGALIDTIRAHRGIINQMLGDGVMATFGAPVESDTHCRDAVRSALDALGRIEALGHEGRIPPIRVGIGIHTGPVLAGNIGNDFRKQYSLTGRTVNVAARIEGLNKERGSRLLISGEVWRQVREEGWPGEDLGEVVLRGFSSPTRIIRLA